MKTQIRILFPATAMFAAVILPLHGQIVADGATNTLSNVSNTITGSVTVGTNGAFTLLTNSANGQIGLNATAKSNEVRLINPSARWGWGSLFVRSNGAASWLVVMRFIARSFRS